MFVYKQMRDKYTCLWLLEDSPKMPLAKQTSTLSHSPKWYHSEDVLKQGIYYYRPILFHLSVKQDCNYIIYIFYLDLSKKQL